MVTETPSKIRDAALSLFSRHWFETVSVAEVCREAGVSNGVFYRYHRSKGDLVRALLEEFLELFERELSAIEGDTVPERLGSLFSKVFNAGVGYAPLVTVYREGQYRFPEYEGRLRAIYSDACERVFGRVVSEAEYLYAISGLRFNSTRAIYDGLPRRPELLVRFVLDGVFPSPGDDTPRVEVPAEFPLVIEEAPTDSRSRFLQSGMRLIGRRAYHEIGVADIARETGLAVGTFYTYFSSKEEFLAEIVEQIGRRTRRYLSRQARTHASRLEQEAYGVWHFLSYFNGHPEYYSIVREAEFVAKPWVRRYYDAFEAGYMENLRIDDPVTRRIAANFLMGLSHYVGIEALLNDRITDIPGFIAELTTLMCTGVQA
ncbi:MAG: TetR/AcrR family transcriptional regulator [Spirochaetota bacterium]